MLKVPTDSLHKFLAIGGLVLLGLGGWYALQNYNRAELSRIEAHKQVLDQRQAYERYAEKVNRQIHAYNDAMDDGESDNKEAERLREMAAQLDAAIPQREKAKTELNELVEKAALMKHHYFMRNL